MRTSDRDTLKRKVLSRRRFLELAGTVAAGALVSSCVPAVPASDAPATTAAPTEVMPTDVPPAAEAATRTPAGVAEATEAAATATSAPTVEGATPVPTEVPTKAPAPVASGGPKVAIGTARDYDRATMESVMRDMLDGIGGLGDVVRPGDRVAMKVNLTGGVGNNGPAGYSPMESFVTHPETVRALAGLVRDAGASEVLIVEAVYQWESYTQWGLDAVAADMGATLVDLNATDPYDDFLHFPVPGGGTVYPDYILNPLLQDVDVFMSIAKMKCHFVAGVTHSLKNLFGLVPARFYRLSDNHSHRSEFHGPTNETAGDRVPKIIVDLNKSRPIHFALVDGVLTTDGGEGPWIGSFGAVQPGALFAGKDPVATDAVATAAQGFDPEAAHYTEPFIRGLNHLALAAAAGLGTNRLSEIEVVGASVEDVRTPFKLATG